MTPRQIELIRSSFRLVQPILADAAELFYDRLFELDPSLRQMFRTAKKEQAQKLAQALTVVVNGIDRPNDLRGAIETLGRRHTGYGVRDEHYATVGTALLWTLEQGLGAAFTSEVREAWTAAYGWLAFTMQEAAAGAMASEPALVM